MKAIRKLSIASGLAYLAMAIGGGFAVTVTTAANLASNPSLFRVGAFTFIIVAILDVFLAWALCILLRPVSKSLSQLTAVFRLVYAAILGSAISHLFTGNLDAFKAEWMIGLIFFGIHLCGVGYLSFKSNYVPKIIGVLLVIAGIGYAFDSCVFFLVPGVNLVISTFTFVGEVAFLGWLLVKDEKSK